MVMVNGGICWKACEMKTAARIEPVFVISLAQLRVDHTNSCNNVTITDKP